MKHFKSLFRFIKPYRGMLVLATISMFVATAMNLIGPWIIRNFIATISKGLNSESLHRINSLALIVIFVYIFRALAQYGQNFVSHYAAWKALEDIRQYLYNFIQGLSLKFFQDKQTGELMSRVINDTRNFEILIAHAIPTIIVNITMLISVTIILLSMNVTLTLYTLIPIPFLIFIILKFNKLSRPRFKDVQKEIADINSVLQDNFTGIKEIKAFTQEKYASKETMKRIVAHTTAILSALRISNAYQPTIQFMSSIGTVIVIFFGGRLALNAELPMEDVVAFLLYLNMFYQPITALGQINEGIQQALASGERVAELLDIKADIREADDAVEMDNVLGQIEFENVNFQYVDNIPIIKNISFKAEAGEMIALVGPTGVGKTTIARLIPRFYDPNSGSIRVDNIDIKRYKINCLRRNISVVSQDVFLFNGTVEDNMLYGKSNASESEIINAAKAANAHDFIMELEDGYQTRVGERGVKLSGGQKQRISIARAVLKDAPILILDEATSAVDTQTELLIQDALRKLMENKTTIVIAHRLSTIQEADQILVLKKGKIVERGTHKDLLQNGGVYSELCEAQIGGMLLDVD